MADEPAWPEVSARLAEMASDDNPVETLEFLAEVARAASAGQDAVGLAVANLFIGEQFEKQQRYQDALSYYEAGLDALSGGTSEFAEDARMLIQRVQQFEKGYAGGAETPGSLDLYRGQADSKALSSMTEAAATATLSTVLAINAGNMYVLQSQSPTADEYFRQAITTASQIGDRIAEAHARSNLAWSAIQSQRFDEADAILEQTLAVLEDPDARVELRKAVLAVGVNARESGDLDAAEAHLQQALGLYRSAGDDTGYGRALAHLGSAFLMQERYVEARDAYLAALRVVEDSVDEEILRHGHGGLARTYQALGEPQTAVGEYTRYFELLGVFLTGWSTDQGRVAIIENRQAMLDGYVTAASDVARNTGNFEPLRDATELVRGNALACLIQSRKNRDYRPSGVADGGAVLYGKEWDYVQMEYASAVSTDLADMMVQRNIHIDLRPSRATLDLTEYCAMPAAAHEINADTPPMIEYYAGPDRLVILLVSNGTVHGEIVGIDKGELEQIIDDYLGAIRVDQPRGIGIATDAQFQRQVDPARQRVLAKRLYEVLIKPVEGRLEPSQFPHLVIVPNGPLWRLPFAALIDGDDNYFGERQRLSYIPSQAAWELLASKSRPADHENVSAWVVGNPEMPANITLCGNYQLTGLPGAEDEALLIETILGAENTELFSGPVADRLRLDAWHGNYTIIHLATHGVACPEDPLSSFIALAELDAADINVSAELRLATLNPDPRLPVQLDLQFDPQHIGLPLSPAYPGALTARHVIQNYRLSADLVTLSACQTGLGQLTGEGMVGFGRAFLAAGARSLVVSLWKVDDNATRELMASFYRGYANHGNKGLALQQAMAVVRRQHPDPRNWAGFVLIGLEE